ncbi:MAG: glycosyltransferase family 2 protein [Gelidibacter sp.]
MLLLSVNFNKFALNMNPNVSIILPNYNHAPYLQERLDSIFNQTYQDFEIIILDDHSTDGSLEILKKYQKHPKVSKIIVNNENSGSPFLQWQKGLKLAKGKFIWIAESDDCCDLNFIETQLEHLVKADVAVAKTIALTNDSLKNEIIHPVFDDSKQDDALLYCPILNVSGVLFKSSLITDNTDSHFSKFKKIGDKVFYFEYFRNANMVFNAQTANHFRQINSSVSKLKNRDTSYYKSYFDEHCGFIKYAQKLDPSITKILVKRYIKKFYGRVSNRVPKEKKWTIKYLNLFIAYKLKILKY